MPGSLIGRTRYFGYRKYWFESSPGSVTFKNREAYNAYQREYQLRRYHKRMNEAKEKLGNKCVDCGVTDKLEIDHKDWATKTIALNKLWSISKARFDEELKKCVLRCRPCHIEKSRLDISDMSKVLGHANQYGYYDSKI